MIHFVKLPLGDGRDVAFPVNLIERVIEPTKEQAAKEFKTGCVIVCTREAPGHEGLESFSSWVIGTVDSVLTKIKDAQEGRTP